MVRSSVLLLVLFLTKQLMPRKLERQNGQILKNLMELFFYMSLNDQVSYESTQRNFAFPNKMI